MVVDEFDRWDKEKWWKPEKCLKEKTYFKEMYFSIFLGYFEMFINERVLKYIGINIDDGWIW